MLNYILGWSGYFVTFWPTQYYSKVLHELSFPGGKEWAYYCRRCRFDTLVGKIPWSRKLSSTPIFLPGKSHGQRSLAGYCPWGRRESDTTDNNKRHVVLLTVWTQDRLVWVRRKAWKWDLI